MATLFCGKLTQELMKYVLCLYVCMVFHNTSGFLGAPCGQGMCGFFDTLLVFVQ